MSDDQSTWLPLGPSGLLALCCVGLASLLGGAAVTSGVAGTTVATMGFRGLGDVLITGLATVVPLVVIGLFIRWRK